MEKLTWVGLLAVVLVVMQALNLYNSAHTARKNHDAPFEKMDERVKDLEKHVMGVDLQINTLKRDIDAAHNKIRENEASAAQIAKAQNKALLAILLWIKDPDHEDKRAIEEAIKDISTS